MTDKITFGVALELAIMDGVGIAREGWNGKGMSVHVQMPDDFSKMKQPYLYINPVNGGAVPWIPSMADLFADDWFTIQP